MSANRIVATLTPFAAVLAGASADWLAKHAPGVQVPSSALEEVFIAGIAAVVAPAAVWMLGWQKHEAREFAAAERAEETDLAAAEMLPAAGGVELSMNELPDELAASGLDPFDAEDDEGLEDAELDDAELGEDDLDEDDDALTGPGVPAAQPVS